MLRSGNDAAVAIANTVAGSMENFVYLMNEYATTIGMKNTNFNNPTGEFDERHYTTASDMQKLVLHAMSIPEFCEIVKCQSYSIPPTEQNKSARKVTNKNHFVSNLLRNDYYYKYSTGIKSGYSPEAKSCIAASAQRGNVHLAALVFGAETKDNVALSFTDCRDMFDYVFETKIL